MPRAPKRTFKTLPAGASGSSTNPETAARNQRRRKLDPLQAKYERARANRGNRISSKIKRLKKQAAYINASTAERASAKKKSCLCDLSEKRHRVFSSVASVASVVPLCRLFGKKSLCTFLNAISLFFH